MKEAKKRGRKPRGVTEEERKAAAREYAKEYYRKNREAIRANVREGQRNSDKAFCLRLEKAEKDIEAIKWELFGRKH